MVPRHLHLPLQCLPYTVKYGWEFLNPLLVSTIIDILPAPSALVEMSSCSCKKEFLCNRCVLKQ